MKLKRALLAAAFVLGLAALICWLATGAHRGWTQTNVPKKTVDEVTGIEATTYQPGFVMGVELLGAVWLAAGLLAGGSFLIRKPNYRQQNQPTPTQ
jgi:hypothetical protein